MYRYHYRQRFIAEQPSKWEMVGTIVTLLVSFDLIILGATMLQISMGIPTPHIPFWDTQMRFILGI